MLNKNKIIYVIILICKKQINDKENRDRWERDETQMRV